MGTLEVLVRYRGDQDPSAAVSMEVPDFYRQAWAQLRISDDPLLSEILGEACEAEAQVIYRLRKDAARDLTAFLSDALLQGMAKHDTINGYPVDHGS